MSAELQRTWDTRAGLKNKSLRYVLISRLYGYSMAGSSRNENLHRGGWEWERVVCVIVCRLIKNA